MSKRISRRKRAEAVSIWRQWRAKGIPSVVTSSEAYRLTSGRIGNPVDHWTMISLASLAMDRALKG